MNFCTKEVLEPVEKAEEKEDLKLEGIVVVWVPDGVAVIVLGGVCLVTRGGEGCSSNVGGLYKDSPKKPKVRVRARDTLFIGRAVPFVVCYVKGIFNG